jgi:hypothetical protein
MAGLRKLLGQFWTYLRAAFLKHLAETIVVGLFIVLGVWLPPLRTWLVTLHPLALSGFLWLAIALAFVITVSWSGREFMKQRRATQERWRNYVDDTIEGVVWVWHWGQISPFDATVQDIVQFARQLVPICPKCTANLDNIHLHHMTGEPEHDAQLSPFIDELGCPRGDFQKRLPPEGYPAYAEHVAHEIIRRARTQK